MSPADMQLPRRVELSAIRGEELAQPASLGSWPDEPDVGLPEVVALEQQREARGDPSLRSG